MCWIAIVLFYITLFSLYIDDWARLRESRWCNPPPFLLLFDVYVLILTSLIIKTTVRSTRRSSKRPTCRKSSPRRPSLRPPPPRCSRRYVSFFFAFWSCFEGGFKRGDKKHFALLKKKRFSLSLSLLHLSEEVSSLCRARALKVSRGTPPPLPFERPRKKKKRWDDERDLSAIRDERTRREKAKNRISSRFALISNFFLVQKDLKKRGKGKEEGEFFLRERRTLFSLKIVIKIRELTFFPSLFLPLIFFLLKTW